jgi:C4-dicarboxylate-specific signal transduction histidine kinase
MKPLLDILLVDDDQVDCLAMSRFAETRCLPYRLHIASSLAEARSRLQTGRFDLAIIDHNLGDGTGLELLHELQDIPAIVLTGAGSEEVAVEALRLRAGDYLVKDPERRYLTLLQPTIERTVARRWTERELRKYTTALEREIAQRTLAEEQLQQHRAELAHVARLSTLGEMGTTLAHELNQPLCAISNYARGGLRRLQTGAGHEGSLHEALKQIALEAERAGGIVRRLRDFVRKRGPRKSTADINEIVQNVVQLVAFEASRRDIAIHLNLAEGLPGLLADSIQIEQVILNLLRNAFEAIEGAQVAQRQVRVVTERGGNEVRVAVHDSAAGLPADLGERIFEPFVTTKPDGLGVGLSISRSIIESHDGRLCPIPGSLGGAAFQFTLPIRSEARAHVA